MGLLGFEVWSWFGNASASGARVGLFSGCDTPIRACRRFSRQRNVTYSVSAEAELWRGPI